MRFLLLLLPILAWAENWPQAGGPDGTWQWRGGSAPVKWSVARNENIAWRMPLANAGQSGIAVWGDRLFLTTFAAGEKGFSGKITGWAVDAKKGNVLWAVTLEGVEKSPMMYAYSDSTSPTPLTDGKFVWFYNASGEMGCWDWNGKAVWKRKFTPWGKPFPFNKQFEPILAGELIYNLEPAEKPGWNYLRALDKKTGRVVWTEPTGTTAYNTPRLGRTTKNTAAILHGRGGWHDVPETPVGLTLTDAKTGRPLWHFVAEEGTEGAPTWQALYVMHWDMRYAYWFSMNPEESHLVLDVETGQLLRTQSLVQHVDYRRWDKGKSSYVTLRDVNLREVADSLPLPAGEVIRVQPAWHANIAVAGYHYFLTSTGHRRNRKPPKGRAGPAYCLGRVNVENGKVEYLELPVAVDDAGKRIYGMALRTESTNAHGEDVATEDRSRMDGWETPAFWGSPVALNNHIYFTTSVGTTYVIDADAKTLDETAILAVNDLGPLGKTWSQNSISFDGKRIYHRTAKELIAIGR
ncbi:MAG TPA: PQQ-binding-like beta-propeller repeat protein [Bryobacteraceae bacterium]|nr:PQQ-binding-like beta-propeller repeat protein [Bryobacteraceae bacterium]